MKVTLDSTSLIVGRSNLVRGRVWQGQTESGIPVVAVIVSIAVAAEHDQSEFERELKTTHAEPGKAAIEAFDLRKML